MTHSVPSDGDSGQLPAHSAGVTFTPYATSAEAWRKVLVCAPSVPPGYEPIHLDYYNRYFSEQSPSFTDLSVVVWLEGRPVAVWALQLTGLPDGRWTIGTNGGAVLAPCLITDVSGKNQKRIRRECMRFLADTCEKHDIATWTTSDVCKADGMTPWQQLANQLAISNSVDTEMYVDLKDSLDAIRSQFRKRAKSNLSIALKKWNCESIQGIDSPAFEGFFRLHVEVSGRQTRSRETWDLQRRAILEKKAYLVVLRSPDSQMVGGGLFITSETDAYYGVAVNRRELFDQPIGHLVLWEAIRFAKESGKRWFDLGTRLYRNLDPHCTPKELSISDFKEAFATRLFPKIRSVIQRNSLTNSLGEDN